MSTPQAVLRGGVLSFFLSSMPTGRWMPSWYVSCTVYPKWKHATITAQPEHMHCNVSNLFSFRNVGCRPGVNWLTAAATWLPEHLREICSNNNIPSCSPSCHTRHEGIKCPRTQLVKTLAGIKHSMWYSIRPKKNHSVPCCAMLL